MKTDNSLPVGFQLKGNERTYTIAEPLGHGGFGITYRAKAEVKVGGIRMKVDFALKEFFMRDDCERQADASIVYSNPARDRVENSRKDFINEALRLKKIGFSHPNIVGFDEVFEANNTAYYVMEYLRGKSLGDYVKEQGPLTEAETVRLMQPVMEAVNLLHRNRICHLDIKPDNIMLEQEENGNIRPVLIDFGLSKHYDNTGHATSTINTFGYSEGYAPAEQYRGITTFSPAADIYALGATLWHCLTGKTPAPALDLRAGELAATLPAGVSEPMRRTIATMTLDQHQRPDSLSGLLPLGITPTPPKVSGVPNPYPPKRDITIIAEQSSGGIFHFLKSLSFSKLSANIKSGSRYFKYAGIGLVVAAFVAFIVFIVLPADSSYNPQATVSATEQPKKANTASKPEQTDTLLPRKIDDF